MVNSAQPLVDLEQQFWELTENKATDMEQQLNGSVALKSVPGSVRTTIAGFTFEEDAVVREAAGKENLRRRQSALEEFRSSATAMRGRLETIGVKPIAVLPEKVWEHLCRESGLYRFETLHENKVRCAEPLSRIRVYAQFLLFQTLLLALVTRLGWYEVSHAIPLSALGLSLALPALALSRRKQRYQRVALDVLANLLPLTVLLLNPVTFPAATLDAKAARLVTLLFPALMTSFICFIEEATVSGRFFERSHSRWLDSMIFAAIPRRVQALLLWPGRLDAQIPDDARSITMQVRFPTPPAEVVALLKKVAGYNAENRPASYTRRGEEAMPIMVAAEAGAIRFGSRDLLDALDEQRRREEEAREALRKDPIIYVKDNGVVAVLAQFGELAIEKELISRVSGVDFLPV